MIREVSCQLITPGANIKLNYLNRILTLRNREKLLLQRAETLGESERGNERVSKFKHNKSNENIEEGVIKVLLT